MTFRKSVGKIQAESGKSSHHELVMFGVRKTLRRFLRRVSRQRRVFNPFLLTTLMKLMRQYQPWVGSVFRAVCS